MPTCGKHCGHVDNFLSYVKQKDKKEIWIPFHEGSVTRFNLDYHQYVKNARELKDKILKYIIKTQE